MSRRSVRSTSRITVTAGAPAALAEMVAACWQGPPMARVAAVETHPHEDPVAPGFAQVPSA